MVFVHVKHYLNKEGRAYFNNTWYPYIKELISQQKGFINIEHSRDSFCEDCMNMVVIFENHEMLMAWVEHADHQKVIDDLDVYRTKGQRWHVSADGSVPELALWDGAS